MALDTRKYERKHTDVLRDLRPTYARLGDWLKKPSTSATLFFVAAYLIYANRIVMMFGDLIFLVFTVFFIWLTIQDRSLAFKMPYGSKWKDKNNEGPGRSGKGEGILYVGNVKDTKEEVWFTNSDARTHILYLGTTGAGKTEGLKSMVTNAMTWGSGFIYVDGKADTDLWSSLSSLVRRFGRDDDLLVLNYMTGNSDTKAPSNTMNPFSSGSASYLTNMLVSLMPDSEGDNAMWKDRAVALVASLMPALTWKRDNQDIPMSVSTIRDYLNLNNIIKISRDQNLPDAIRVGIKGYLDTLPGYVDDAFDDEGNEKPAGPDQPQYDTTTPRQQHGYLSMQFTRSLQSLGDEYGYIFDTQAADVDMVDVVLNRRILITLIPALEKSADETANLGKIVAATLKGMMGSALGAEVEGESATVIENKPTNSATPFMTVFDEVGYYTAQGMAVMAAQARSLGFCLIYAAQDLPALEKRVREEARSITANCNIKIFGKLEDPTQTKEFFEKTVGSAMVIEASGFQQSGGSTASYMDTKQAGLQVRARASYDGLKAFKEGEAVVAFGEMVVDATIFYSNPGHAKAMRVTRYVSLPPPDETFIKHAETISKVRDRMVHKTWTAAKADVAEETPREIAAMAEAIEKAQKVDFDPMQAGMAALVSVHALDTEIDMGEKEETDTQAVKPQKTPPPVSSGNTPVPPPERKDPPLSTAPPKQQATPPQTAQPEKPPEKNDAPAAATGNPMAFFSGKKESGDQENANKEPPSASEPPPSAPPAQTNEPKQAASNEISQASANPMAFFSSKKSAESADSNERTDQPPPASPEQSPEQKTSSEPARTEETKKPVSWEDLAKEAEQAVQNVTAHADSATAAEKPSQATNIQTAPYELPAEAKKHIKKAGESAKKAIFKNKNRNDSENSDAAE